MLTTIYRKSKLRKPVELALGSQYAGARVSREALMNDDDDEEDESSDEEANEESIVDPDTVDLDAEDIDGEIDSDEALGESDDEKLKSFVFRGSGKPRVPVSKKLANRPTATDFMSDSEDEKMDGAEKDEQESESEDDDDMMMDAEDVAEEIEISGEEVTDSDESEGVVQIDGEETGSEEEDEEESENEDQSDVDAEDGEEEDEEESESEEESNYDAKGSDEESARRAELKKMMSEEQKTVVATISQAAKADQDKGVAVKAQRKTFDSLLNVRIRLQKALVATNSLAAADHETDDSTPYKAAEEAAVKLLNTLNSMRHSLEQTDKSSKKRKYTAITTETSSSDIWAQLQKSETQGLPKRQATLEKWSAKVRGTTATPVSRKLNQVAESSITDVLATQLSGTNGARLAQRTHMPRSCAPVQVKAKLVESAEIFDDADFYQLLLKELVDQRMVEAGSAPAGALGAPVAQWAAVKEAKTKRQVDTKASKGRKMKFTVHEKLQNFMAPEDRTTWEPEAVDRFFGTLLGQRMDLGEEVQSDEDEDDKLGEEEALMLFRS